MFVLFEEAINALTADGVSPGGLAEGPDAEWVFAYLEARAGALGTVVRWGVSVCVKSWLMERGQGVGVSACGEGGRPLRTNTSHRSTRWLCGLAGGGKRR